VQARVAVMMREQRQQADSWRQQNEQDQRADMQQLEGLMLRVGPPVVSSSRTSSSLPRPCSSLPCNSDTFMRTRPSLCLFTSRACVQELPKGARQGRG
jgi:hypothetical protein